MAVVVRGRERERREERKRARERARERESERENKFSCLVLDVSHHSLTRNVYRVHSWFDDFRSVRSFVRVFFYRRGLPALCAVCFIGGKESLFQLHPMHARKPNYEYLGKELRAFFALFSQR